ncbi:hypothetical protein HOLleu_10773 [Holothuria leucospilota]|uniref:EamA domain-containing protein n=1 Tax=Holothuria leucospilota TaxID=206669 RepID=A0A9Q1CER4_HOLLE|nr:hypothetical protein HOLleu_10773 [Holothuria leucospilota]
MGLIELIEPPLKAISKVNRNLCNKMDLSRYYGIGFSLLYVLISTAITILLHIAATRMNPLDVVLWNAVCVNCICVVAVCIKKPKTTGNMKEILLLTLSGFFGGCSTVSFATAVMVTTEPGDVVSLYFTLPISVIILGFFFDEARLKIVYVIFAFLSLAGVVFVVKPNFLFHSGTDGNAISTLGVILSLCSSFLMAAHFITVRRLKIFATDFTLVVFLTNTFVLLISVMLCVYFRVFKFPDSVGKVLLILSMGSLYGSVYALMYLALTNEEPVVVSVIMTSEVALTYIGQYGMLNLTVTWCSVVGGILITLSCLGVAVTKQNEEDPENKDLLQEN